MQVRVTNRYTGGSEWMCLFGAGEVTRNAAFKKQVAAGKRAACFDLGYFGRTKIPETAYVRVSVDHLHPQAWLHKTPPYPTRWDRFGINLRDDFDPNGHVVVAGMGPKSKLQFNLYDWETKALQNAQTRFPDRRILYRPKRDAVKVNWEQDSTSPIEDVLRGASLAICRHSNVAVDACVAGVPVETEDGAAKWLYGPTRNPNEAQRLDFLRRLMWWQWRCDEMGDAWKFLLKVCV